MQTPSDGGRQSPLLALALVVLVVAAGCSSLPGAGDATDEPEPVPTLNVVPEGTTAVLHADAGGALNDDALRTVLDGVVSTLVGPTPGGEVTVRNTVSTAENRTGLDADELTGVTFFSKATTVPNATEIPDASELGYAGAVLAADWSKAEFAAALRSGSRENVTETTHAGLTAYVGPNATWVGTLGDGRFVVGTERAVTDAMAVAAGEAAAFDNDVRAAFASTGAGHLRYAAAVPQDGINTSGIGGYDTAPFEAASTVRGSVATTPDGNVSVTANVRFASASAATDAAEMAQGAIAATRERTDNATARLLTENRLSVAADGNELTLVATNEPDTYVALVRALVLLGGSA